MSTPETPPGQPGAPPTEDELRAAYEAEIKQLRIEHVLLEHVVSLVNLGMRRTGLARGTEDERDPAQVQLAIEAIRAALPLLEHSAPEQVKPIRDALAQLQLAFVRIGGSADAGAPSRAPASGAATSAGQTDVVNDPTAVPPAAAPDPAPKPPESGEPGEPGPAQRSGRLWIPGQ